MANLEQPTAGLRVLVCIAQSDGVIHERERESLQASLDEVDFPGKPTLDQLLAGRDDFDALLGQIDDADVRRNVYASAFALAMADGDCGEYERNLLKRMQARFAISDEETSVLERLFAPSGQVVRDKPGAVPAFTAIERAEKVKAETRKTAIVSAVLGAFPFPALSIATDLAVAGLQVGLARDIGKFWGREMDDGKAKALLAGFGVGTGARIAVTNLLKFFPGWGSAAGAAAAYASSHAVGKVVDEYFEGGAAEDAAGLRDAFRRARSEGKAAFAGDKTVIAQTEQTHRERVEQLQQRLRAGEIGPEQFQHALLRLG